MLKVRLREMTELTKIYLFQVQIHRGLTTVALTSFHFFSQERSSEFTVAGRVLFDRLDAITVKPSFRASRSEEIGTLPLSMQV
jgi:hypothetical protein